MKDKWRRTTIGLIPSEWDIQKIEEYCHILNNQRKPLSSSIRFKMKGKYPYCGANGIVDYINDYKFDGTYVLLAEDGGNFHDYRIKPITYMMKGKFWVNNHAHILQAKNGNHYFLHYNLVHRDITKYIIGSTRTKLNKSALESIELPIPPLPEQQKIADILSTVDKKIAVIDQQITASEELKKGLMQRLLTKGIGHTEFKDSPLGKIPKSWEVKNLGVLLDRIKGGGTPSKENSEYWKPEIPWITVKDLKNSIIDDSIDYISKAGLNNSAANLIPAWTLIISTRMAVGKAVFVTKDVTINQDLKALFLKDNLNKFFLFHWFNCNSEKILNLASGSTVKGIRLEVLKDLKVALPPISEQKDIAEILSKVDDKLQTQKDKKQAYQQLKKGLMQQLLTGKIRVNQLLEA
ncbi:restriction endonuclease subunit S [Mesonia sp. K4-1]|uniref:restriction endonuclease subunit S n=1 Tax=Mesonia sp. K4-1 TaxID=2602760 RepID=UPI0011CB23E8|nr:restriction endonuclease subunit S [Mesonia sp. K4-1]TXK75055.1 hypothetical protein FT986_11145 [Mesonia sp. K4-1]